MSECVVRMEMPKRCFECPMHDWIRSSVICNAHHDLKPIPNADEKPSWCPIICQLPEGHGRLVDADVLKENRWDADTRCGYVQVVDVGEIDNAPTIVPTERSET